MSENGQGDTPGNRPPFVVASPEKLYADIPKLPAMQLPAHIWWHPIPQFHKVVLAISDGAGIKVTILDAERGDAIIEGLTDAFRTARTGIAVAKTVPPHPQRN